MRAGGLSLFDALLVGHLVGDFLLQNRWMAERKSTQWPPLLVHSLIYTACVTAAGLLGGGLPWPAVLLVFLSHVVLDRQSFVTWWGRRIQTLRGPAER